MLPRPDPGDLALYADDGRPVPPDDTHPRTTTMPNQLDQTQPAPPLAEPAKVEFAAGPTRRVRVDLDAVAANRTDIWVVTDADGTEHRGWDVVFHGSAVRVSGHGPECLVTTDAITLAR